jgi:hypothetical protein
MQRENKEGDRIQTLFLNTHNLIERQLFNTADNLVDATTTPSSARQTASSLSGLVIDDLVPICALRPPRRFR